MGIMSDPLLCSEDILAFLVCLAGLFLPKEAGNDKKMLNRKTSFFYFFFFFFILPFPSVLMRLGPLLASCDPVLHLQPNWKHEKCTGVTKFCVVLVPNKLMPSDPNDQRPSHHMWESLRDLLWSMKTSLDPLQIVAGRLIALSTLIFGLYISLASI